MSKGNFNKVALKHYWNYNSAEVLCKFSKHVFSRPPLKGYLWILLKFSYTLPYYINSCFYKRQQFVVEIEFLFLNQILG